LLKGRKGNYYDEAWGGEEKEDVLRNCQGKRRIFRGEVSNSISNSLSWTENMMSTPGTGGGKGKQRKRTFAPSQGKEALSLEISP